MRYLFNILCIVILASTLVDAQQTPLLTQQRFHHILINPALAGAHAYTDIKLGTRSQWLGMDDAPGTYMLSGSFRLLKKSLDIKKSVFGKNKVDKREEGNIGFAGYIMNDNNSHIGKTSMGLSYAYHFRLDDASQMSLGLTIMGNQVRFDKEELFTLDPNDQVYDDLRNIWAFDAAFGAYYTYRHLFYAGLSVDQALKTISFTRIPTVQYDIERHYYLISGYRFRLNYEYDLEPNLVVKSTKDFFKAQADLTVLLYYKNDYWGGIAYRSSNDFIFILGVNYKFFGVGYSFDYGLNKVIRSSFGSHELMLNVRIGASDRRFRYQRRYF